VNVLSSIHCAIPSIWFEETVTLPVLLARISPFLPAVSSVLLLDLDDPITQHTNLTTKGKWLPKLLSIQESISWNIS
jgi:hypothetical protein